MNVKNTIFLVLFNNDIITDKNYPFFFFGFLFVLFTSSFLFTFLFLFFFCLFCLCFCPLFIHLFLFCSSSHCPLSASAVCVVRDRPQTTFRALSQTQKDEVCSHTAFFFFFFSFLPFLSFFRLSFSSLK